MKDFIIYFKKKYPNIKLEIYKTLTVDAESALRRRDTDLMFACLWDVPGKSNILETIALKHLTNTLFTSKYYAKKNGIGTTITKKQLEQLQMVSLTKRYHARDYLQEYGLIKHTSIDVDTTQMMLEYVENELGVGYCVSEYFDDKNGKLIKLTIADDNTADFSFWFVCRYNKDISNKATILFINEIKDFYKI